LRAADAGRRPGLLYGIADLDALGADRFVDAVRAMAEAGIETIQIRAKRASDRVQSRLCESCLRALEGWPGQLLIDDRVDLALLLDLDGVHLGQDDLPWRNGRELLGSGALIGGSSHDETQLAALDGNAAVDWIAFGPIFPTRSKERPDRVVGLERLRAARACTGKPLIAIGGIDESNLADVLSAGADSAAILSALATRDVGASCRRLLAVSRAAE
jgi:thiamine-phosphate pyrophosphorylase